MVDGVEILAPLLRAHYGQQARSAANITAAALADVVASPQRLAQLDAELRG